MSFQDAPRDAYTATDVWVPVDATGEDFYELGSRFGTQVGVFSELHEETGHPYLVGEGAGFFDPRCLRWHRLQKTFLGVPDNRLAVQVVNDYEAEYTDARPGDAPFGQPEYFTSLNRTTREVDTSGRVALPSSHRRVIDSEDDRYALALTCRSVPLHTAELSVPVEPGGEGGVVLPPDVRISKPDRDDEGAYGGVTRTRPSVSIGGVTFFGQGAVSAAQSALAQGGTSADAARWASAAARGLPMPPLLGRTAERKKRDPGPTRVRQKDKDPGWGVPLLNHPAGYVWSTADVIGLLGTLVVPEGAGGSYFSGKEGTPIGPLPWRHDAQVSMGKDLVGRIVFVSNDAAGLEEGQGKLCKGELWADSSRANQDTELGLETVQWRPVVPVDADLPPSRPPPWDPPWVDPPPEEEEEEEDDDPKKKRKKPQRPWTGGRGRHKPGEGPDEDMEDGTQGREIAPEPGGVDTDSPDRLPSPRRRVEPGGEDGSLPPVSNPGAQARDYTGPGEPCPNSTAGVLRRSRLDDGTRYDPRGFGLKRLPGGGYVEYLGYPALNLTPEGLSVGGFEGLPDKGQSRPRGVDVGPPSDDPGTVPLGLPRGKRTGVDVGPPSDDPGRVPLGLPKKKRKRPGGFDIDPPLGGDKGIPRGAEERWKRRQRRERARRAREARDKRERKRLDELEEMEERARRKGKTRLADRIKRARNRIEKRRKRRQEKKRRRKEYQDKLKKQREERKKKREERRKKRREARKRRRRKKRKKKRKRGVAQGGYVIDTTDRELRERSEGKLDADQKKRLEEDRKREKERRRRQRELWEEEAKFGDWNVANARLPFFGSVGGPSSLEGWSHLVTYQVRAMQRVVTGAFGGPSYLAGNLGIVHRNRPGNPPAGSRIGAWWTAAPGQKLDVQAVPVEVVSVLEAQAGGEVCAHTGGVLEVSRVHRGQGLIEDTRPLVLLRNGGAKADLLADEELRVRVTHEGCVRAACFHAYSRPGEGSGPLLEVGRVDGSGRVVERFLSVERDGTVCVFGELKVAKEPSPLSVELDPLSGTSSADSQ